MKLLALFLLLVTVLFAVAPMLAQAPLLRAEYIRLGDRVLAVEKATNWLDDFNRLNLGANWSVENPFNTPYSVQVRIFNSQMRWDGWPVGGGGHPAVAKPLPIQASLDGLPQWAQVTFKGYSTPDFADTKMGPAVLYKGTLSPATARGYFLELTFKSCGINPVCVTQGLTLTRLDQQPSANYANVLVPFVEGLAVGDVIRIEVVPGATQNVVRGYRGTNLVFNYIDSDPNRVPMQGSPAVYCHYLRMWHNGADIVDLDDFSAGSL